MVSRVPEDPCHLTQVSVTCFMFSLYTDHLKDDEVVTLEMLDSRIYIKEQISEYINCGKLLETWNYLDFFLGTYDGKCLKEKTSKHG